MKLLRHLSLLSFVILAAACSWSEKSLYNTGSDGYYWSTSLYTDYQDSAYRVGFGSSGVSHGSSSRYLGLSIRPVTE